MSDDADYIQTQIVGTDNIGAQIAQDIIVTTIVTGLVEDAVYGGIYQLGGKQALQAGVGRYDTYFTKEMMENLAKVSKQKIKGSISQRIGKVFAKNSAEKALKILGKQAAKAGARSGAIAAGGCTIGPAGCAAGAVVGGMVFVADLAFTIFTTIQDIQDKDGLLNIFHKAEIEAIRKDFEDALNAGAAEAGFPGLMDEEVMFYPEYFVYDFSEDGSIQMDPNNEWARKYVEYRNEYLESKGIPSDWQRRLKEQGNLKIPEKPKNLAKSPGGDSNNISMLLMSSSSCFCLLILISLLLVTG